MTKRTLGVAVVLLVAATGAWLYTRGVASGPVAEDAVATPEEWLDQLYSRNPREVEAAAEDVAALGARALPTVLAALRNPDSEAERIKAALKAAGIIGQAAAPAIPDVAALLPEQGVTSEAAIALSYMGPEAFPPLREALASQDPIVRRESLRSIGKLKDRAPLDRAVGATYLGIIHEGPETALPALSKGLADPDAEVRRASAAAIGSFTPTDAAPVMPELRKASTDRNEDVAREAGRTIVKLQGAKEGVR